MASIKGIGVTIAVLVGVVVASFLVYLIPEDTTMKITVYDFEKHLDDIDEKTSMLSTAIEKPFDDLINQKLSADEYFDIATATQTQINSLIIELTSSGAPQEWTESYANYIGALKKLNEKITETIVVANLMSGDSNSNSINEIIAKIHQLETESLDLMKKSDNTRP